MGASQQTLLMPAATAAATARWNSADCHADLTLSSSDRVCTRSSANDGNWRSVRSVTSHSTGKWFARIADLVDSATNGSMIGGVAVAGASLSNYPGSDTNSWGLQCNNFTVTSYYNAASTAHGALPPTDPVTDEGMFVAVDFDAGELWLGTENLTNTAVEWAGGGDAEAGTTPTYTFTANTELFLILGQQFEPQQSRLDNSTGEGQFLPSGFAMWD